ncbi:MAG: helix-turn-helix domain-containing protein [Aliidongia sp.]
MYSTKGRASRQELIEFGANTRPCRVQSRDWVSYDGVKLALCLSKPIEGTYVRTAQITAALHEGEAFDIDWRGPGSDRPFSCTIPPGGAHIGDGRLPFWVRHTASPSFFVFAIEEYFVRDIWQTAFGGCRDGFIEPAINVDDPVVKRFCELGRIELLNGGVSGRLYAEGLATAFTMHLLTKYAENKQSPAFHKGGVAPTKLRRVVEFIGAHLDEDLKLADLAAIAEMSSHHFGEAFKLSTGTSPHHYVMEQRVQAARQLLGDSERPIAEIAYATGFASQAHLTENFHRRFGATPAQYRRSRR